jgi:glycerate-2-kinase
MMIKNYKALASTALRKKALDILIAGLESALPSNVLSKSVQFKEDSLIVCNDKFGLNDAKLYVIGGGKAAGTMAEGLEKIIPPERITRGIVNTNADDVKTQKIRIQKASHPIPGQNGLDGVKQMLEIANDIKEEDIVICLISGGGSALLPCPVDGISLEDMRKMTSLLLKSGAGTYEVQYIRKHISGIKGGQLAKLLQPAKVITLILTDVINPEDITAAGPTEPDDSTFGIAYGVLKKYGLLEKIPETIVEHLEKGMKGDIPETPKKTDSLFNNVHNYIIADYRVALNAMKAKAEELGFKVELHREPFLGEVKHTAKEMGNHFKGKYKSENVPYAFIYGSDMVVSVKGNGRGGRNQEYIAALIEEIKDIKDCVIVSADTDGVDFTEGVGGAIADNLTYAKAKKLGLEIDGYLDENNTHALHEQLGTHLQMDVTGTNVGDLNVYLQEK